MNKRLLASIAVLALLMALPAVSQDGNPTMEERVRTLEGALVEQQGRIDALEAYTKVLKGEAETLRVKVAKAEKEGFLLPAPNNSAKKALLDGLSRFAASAAAGKAPEPDAEDE